MERIALGLVIATALAATTVTGCDELTVPPQPDGGTASSSTSSGAPAPTTGTSPLMPAGALPGQGALIEGVQTHNWIELDTAGKIKQIVWTLPITAVNAIPATAKDWMFFGSNLPPEAATQTGMKGVTYSYMPHGHIPQGVYDIPHWEFHVTFLTAEEFGNIDCTDKRTPPDSFLPGGWLMSLGDGELGCTPKVGYHAFNLKAPEYNGERFTRSFLLSYYAGDIVGYEPKFTVELLKERKTPTVVNPPDLTFLAKKDKSLPTEFEFRYDDKTETYLGILKGFKAGTQ